MKGWIKVFVKHLYSQILWKYVSDGKKKNLIWRIFLTVMFFCPLSDYLDLCCISQMVG